MFPDDGLRGAAKRAARPALERSPALRTAVDKVRGTSRRLRRPPKTVAFADMEPAQAFRVAFNVVLRREPNDDETRDNLPLVRDGVLSRPELVDRLRGSVGYRFGVPFPGAALPQSLHMSRCEFILGLPRARNILDIGGGDVTDPEGALVSMGYPYPFESLTIIDLPDDERHPLYQAPEHTTVQSRLGPITYRYHSMLDLSQYPSDAFDLVYSGQSIEHVTEAEADHVLREVRRVLRPGGHLALDTPNGRITRLQQAEFIDLDHEVEYCADALEAKLRAAGLEICERRGLNFAGTAAALGRFDFDEAARNRGVFSEVEDCYLLAYVCRKPA